MMNEKLFFTRRGLVKFHKKIEEMEKRLQYLQSQIAYVAEVGGNQWHDNAAYESLVIDIREMDRRIACEYQILNKVILVNPLKNFDKITIGAKVKIIRDGKKITWEIVGFGESSPNHNMLAYNTPLASLIMGKCKGETIIGIIAGKQTKIQVLEITKGSEESDEMHRE